MSTINPTTPQKVIPKSIPGLTTFCTAPFLTVSSLDISFLNQKRKNAFKSIVFYPWYRQNTKGRDVTRPW